MRQRVNFLHCPQHLPAQLGIGAKLSCGCVCDRSHTAKRSDKEKFHPQGGVNVVRDFRVDPSVIENGFDRPDAIRAPIIQFADYDRRCKAGMSNMAGRDYKADNLAQASHDPLGAQDFCELRHSINSVLQREYSSLRTNDWFHFANSFGYLPGFDAHDHEVNWPNLVYVICTLGRKNDEVTFKAINLQPRLLDCA